MTGRVTRTGTYLTETGVESGTISHTAAIPRERLQELLDAIHREGGWRDTDTVAELLMQFLDAQGFDL